MKRACLRNTIPAPVIRCVTCRRLFAGTVADVVYLCLGGMAWRDELGWRWTNSRSPRIHDIWNPALIAALDERATA